MNTSNADHASPIRSVRSRIHAVGNTPNHSALGRQFVRAATIVVLAAAAAGALAPTSDARPNNPCANARAALRASTLALNSAHRTGNQHDIEFWRINVFDSQQAVLAAC